MATMLYTIFGNISSIKTYVLYPSQAKPTRNRPQTDKNLHWICFTRIQWTIWLHIWKYKFHENLCLIETSLNLFHKDPMNNMAAFVQLTSMSFKCIFFNIWLQIRFPLICFCKEIYHSMNAHTLALLICIYKHNLSISIYILHRRKFIHTPDNARLFYIIWRLSAFFSSEEIMTFIIIIIYELIAAGWSIHESKI